MKLLVVNNQGEVIGQVSNLDQYDLNNAWAQAELCEEVADIISHEDDTLRELYGLKG